MRIWLTIAGLAVGTAAIKAIGPAVLGRRVLPARSSSTIALTAPSLLAALVVYETVHAEHQQLVVDERLVGLCAAAIALAARLPLTIVMAIAVLSAVLVRVVV